MTSSRPIDAALTAGAAAALRCRSGTRGPLPSISTETIYEYAIDIVDREGADALTIRRLAGDLGISTRTLYKRIGSRERMLRDVVDLHFSRLDLRVIDFGSAESTTVNWCMVLHRGLVRHPNFTELLTTEAMESAQAFIRPLIEICSGDRIPRLQAEQLCRSLVRVTVADGLRAARLHREGIGEREDSPADFAMVIGWIVAGVRAAGAVSDPVGGVWDSRSGRTG